MGKFHVHFVYVMESKTTLLNARYSSPNICLTIYYCCLSSFQRMTSVPLCVCVFMCVLAPVCASAMSFP